MGAGWGYACILRSNTVSSTRATTDGRFTEKRRCLGAAPCPFAILLRLVRSRSVGGTSQMWLCAGTGSGWGAAPPGEAGEHPSPAVSLARRASPGRASVALSHVVAGRPFCGSWVQRCTQGAKTADGTWKHTRTMTQEGDREVKGHGRKEEKLPRKLHRELVTLCRQLVLE